MPLLDAMLLEGYRDPREVYIALRTDGLKGSGTIDIRDSDFPFVCVVSISILERGRRCNH